MKYQLTQFPGMKTSRRDSGADIVSNFDITQENALTPVVKMESETSRNIRRVAIGSEVYGLEFNGTGKPQVTNKANVSTAWEGSAYYTNSVGTYTGYDEMFLYYAATNALYYWSGNYIFEYDITGAAGTETSIGSSSSRTDAFVNPNDGKVYFGRGEQLHRIDQAGTISTDIAPSIPDEYNLRSLDSHGVYLAVGCSSTEQAVSSRRSVVYLVDVDITTPAPVDVIDFGQGDLRVIGSIGGYIVAAIETANGVAIRYWSGGDEAKELTEIECDISSGGFENMSVVDIDKMYFALKASNVRGESANDYSGIWSVGFDRQGQLQVSMEQSPVYGANEAPQTLSYVSGVFYTTTGADTLYETNTVTTANETGEYITEKISSTNIGEKLDLEYVVLRTEPLTTTAGANVYYRVDEDTAWTQIIAETDDDNVVTRKEHDNAGDRFKEGYEYQFKIESTLGAKITGFSANFKRDNE